MRSLGGMGLLRWTHCDWYIIGLCFIANGDLLGPIDNEHARLSMIPWVRPWI